MINEHILVLDINQLKDDKIFKDCFNKVSPGRQDRVQRHAMEIGKRQSLGAGLVLNEILEYFSLNPVDRNLEWGENQKPYIPGHPEIHFNLTHSGSYAAGVWGGSPVGIDIEQIGTMREGVARRFFHEGELRWLERIPAGARQAQGFFRLWVLKESFMKSTGLGMRLPLNAFEVLIEEDGVQVKHSVDDKTYHFLEFELKGCRGAVCSQDPAVRDWGIQTIHLR